MAMRVVTVGLGPIGTGVSRQLIERPGFELVAAVDVDPAKTGRDVGTVCGLARPVGLPVEADLGSVLEVCGAEVAVLCTSSALASIESELGMALNAGLPVVSTTEELSYPSFTQDLLAKKIDTRAKRAGVAVLGTGVNPGFAMDTLPIVLTGACERVDSIRVDRVQDASFRRIPFQQKIGSGLHPDDFREKVRQGRMGHVGLTESIAMIAGALGWNLENITDVVEPRIAEEPVNCGYLPVEVGHVTGIVQDGVGYSAGEAVIRLHMEAFLGAPETYDSVVISGSPNLSSRIEGGIQGDVATASVAVNCIPRVLRAAPGLHTMTDLPLPSYWSGATNGFPLR